MSPIRVAHVIQYFAIGGLERMVQSLAVGSRALGIESVVIGYLSDGPIRAELEGAGVRTHMLTPHRGMSPRYVIGLRAALRSARIDVVHTHHVGPFLYGAAAALSCGIPVVHTEHSHELYESLRLRWAARAMDRVAHVVAVSPEIAAYRRAAFGRACEVVPNGVACLDVAPARQIVRRELGVGSGTFVVGCVARFAPEKDHATLLRGFALLRQRAPDCVLVLVGEGPARREVTRLVAELGLSPHVRLLGARSDVSALLSGFDAVALTSQREGLPLSLLEAMAQRRPVVATRVGGVPELLREGAGLLIDVGDHEVCATQLHALQRSPVLRDELGDRGFRRVSTQYGVKSMVDSYLRVYEEVLRGRLLRTKEESCMSVS